MTRHGHGRSHKDEVLNSRFLSHVKVPVPVPVPVPMDRSLTYSKICIVHTHFLTTRSGRAFALMHANRFKNMYLLQKSRKNV